MAINYFKKQKRITGGHLKYRTPLVFNARKAKPDKDKTPVKINYRVVSAILILIILYYFLFWSSFFRIKDFLVEGNSLVATQKLIESLPKDENIFRVKTSSLENKLKTEFPEIKDVKIYRGIPNALKIVVLEHDNKLVWQTGGRRFFLSSQGVVSRELPPEEGSALPMVIDTKNFTVLSRQSVVSPSFVSFIENVNNNLNSRTNLNPDHFEVMDTTFDVNLIIKEGFYIKLNSLRSSDVQLDNLKTILISKRDQIHEYVDMRINGWAYYK